MRTGGDHGRTEKRRRGPRLGRSVLPWECGSGARQPHARIEAGDPAFERNGSAGDRNSPLENQSKHVPCQMAAGPHFVVWAGPVAPQKTAAPGSTPRPDDRRGLRPAACRRLRRGPGPTGRRGAFCTAAPHSAAVAVVPGGRRQRRPRLVGRPAMIVEGSEPGVRGTGARGCGPGTGQLASPARMAQSKTSGDPASDPASAGPDRSL
jgi:hypothetical protein